MPKFRLTLTKIYTVNTDDWDPSDDSLRDELTAMGVAESEATEDQLVEAMRQLLLIEPSDIVDLDEVDMQDFTVDLIR